jgi:hypothetical protein
MHYAISTTWGPTDPKDELVALVFKDDSAWQAASAFDVDQPLMQLNAYSWPAQWERST